MSDGPTQDARMTHRGPPATYGTTARVLHWTTAVLVLILLPLGVVIANKWGGPLQDFLYNLHRSIGAVIIPIVIRRLGYRITHAPTPLPADVPPLQQAAARATHWALYALLMVQPFLGWVATSAFPAPIPVFGLFELPPIGSTDRPLSDRLFMVHALIAVAIGCLATLHVGVALYHHFLRRDGVLMRMITN
jgi:cytochrome b561